MDPLLGKAAFHIGFYIAFVAGVLLFFLEKQTAEYVITQITFGIGVTFLCVVVLLVRWGQSRDR